MLCDAVDKRVRAVGPTVGYDNEYRSEEAKRDGEADIDANNACEAATLRHV